MWIARKPREMLRDTRNNWESGKKYTVFFSWLSKNHIFYSHWSYFFPGCQKSIYFFPLVIYFFPGCRKIIYFIPTCHIFFSWLSKNHIFSSTVYLFPRTQTIQPMTVEMFRKSDNLTETMQGPTGNLNCFECHSVQK